MFRYHMRKTVAECRPRVGGFTGEVEVDGDNFKRCVNFYPDRVFLSLSFNVAVIIRSLQYGSFRLVS